MDACMGRNALWQWSPTFLAPETGFMEDSFSTDWVGGMVQAVMWAVGSGRWSFTHSSAAHLLLCSLGVGDPCIGYYFYPNSPLLGPYFILVIAASTGADRCKLSCFLLSQTFPLTLSWIPVETHSAILVHVQTQTWKVFNTLVKILPSMGKETSR